LFLCAGDVLLSPPYDILIRRGGNRTKILDRMRLSRCRLAVFSDSHKTMGELKKSHTLHIKRGIKNDQNTIQNKD